MNWQNGGLPKYHLHSSLRFSVVRRQHIIKSPTFPFATPIYSHSSSSLQDPHLPISRYTSCVIIIRQQRACIHQSSHLSAAASLSLLTNVTCLLTDRPSGLVKMSILQKLKLSSRKSVQDSDEPVAHSVMSAQGRNGAEDLMQILREERMTPSNIFSSNR